jgi:hypothetical protein
MQLPSSGTGFMTVMSPMLFHSANKVLISAHGKLKRVRLMILLSLCPLLMDTFSVNWNQKRRKYWMGCQVSTPTPKKDVKVESKRWVLRL